MKNDVLEYVVKTFGKRYRARFEWEFTEIFDRYDILFLYHLLHHSTVPNSDKYLKQTLKDGIHSLGEISFMNTSYPFWTLSGADYRCERNKENRAVRINWDTVKSWNSGINVYKVLLRSMITLIYNSWSFHQRLQMNKIDIEILRKWVACAHMKNHPIWFNHRRLDWNWGHRSVHLSWSCLYCVFDSPIFVQNTFLWSDSLYSLSV